VPDPGNRLTVPVARPGQELLAATTQSRG